MQKNQGIELLRIISTFSVVWFHCGTNGREIAYGGLIIFLVISMYLAGNSEVHHGNILLRRAKRLLLPWLIWFVIYGLINVLNDKPFICLNNGIIAGILAGPYIHLWYLPFIFTCLALFDLLKEFAPPSFLGSASAFLVILILALTSIWRYYSIQLEAPFAQYAHASAGVFMGIFFSYFHKSPSNLILLFLILFVTVTALPYPGIGIPYLIGIIAGCLIISQNGVLPNFGIESLSQHMFGVYLIHPMFFGAIKRIPAIQREIVPIIVFILSIVAIWIIKRYSPRVARLCT